MLAKSNCVALLGYRHTGFSISSFSPVIGSCVTLLCLWLAVGLAAELCLGRVLRVLIVLQQGALQMHAKAT